MSSPMDELTAEIPFAPMALNDGNEEELEEDQLLFYLSFLTLMLFFFFAAGYIEKVKPPFGHETGLTIIVGFIFSIIFWYIEHEDKVEVFRFKQGIFFNFFLPPIIFNSGYNMRRKKFFQNIGNVAIFGLCVTLVCFTVYSTITWMQIKKMDLDMYNYVAMNEGKSESEWHRKIDLDIMPMLLFSSLLCSSDVVAAVSIVSYEAQPKLFSCIFGEGVFNDIVSIILFNTVQGLQGKPFEWYTPFQIFGQFLMLGVVSITIGLFAGLLTSIVFKHVRFLTVSAITETFLIFAFAEIAYFASEMTVIAGIQMSGIISLLTCGVVQAHYCWYNLSPQGKSSTSVTFGFLGTAAEAAVYSYIGIGLYSLIPTWWSVSFTMLQFIMIVIGRICCIILTFYTFRLCFKKKTISFRELLFISYGGMIRGAIAFALVLKIAVCDEETTVGCYSIENYELAVSTTMCLVAMTTLLFGTFMAWTQKKLVPPSIESANEYGEMTERTSSQISANEKKESEHEEHEHETHLHPNEIKDIDPRAGGRRPTYIFDDKNEPASFATSGFVKWFSKFDEETLKPFLILNYDAQKADLQDQLHELNQANFETDDVHELAQTVRALDDRKRTVMAGSVSGLSDIGGGRKSRVHSTMGMSPQLLDGRRYHGDTSRFAPGALGGTVNATSAKDLINQVGTADENGNINLSDEEKKKNKNRKTSPLLGKEKPGPDIIVERSESERNED